MTTELDTPQDRVSGQGSPSTAAAGPLEDRPAPPEALGDPAMNAGTGWATVGVGVAIGVLGIVLSGFFGVGAELVTTGSLRGIQERRPGPWLGPVSIVGQALTWVVLPLLWARRRSLGGAARFLWLRFRPLDLLWGLLMALIAKGGAVVLSKVVLSSAESAQGADLWKGILGAPGVGPKVAMILGAAVLTPIGEELLFRGMFLQGPRRWGRYGAVLAMVVSSLVFTAVHAQWTQVSPKVAAFGFLSVAMLAVVNVVVIMRTRRLGAAMWCHFLYNISGVLAVFLLTS